VRLASPDAGPGAAAEALLAVTEQVAQLRSIGSQTHPALQQLVLAHDQQLAALAQQLAAAGLPVAENAPVTAVGG
jgi:exonuclease VII large subunit